MNDTTYTHYWKVALMGASFAVSGVVLPSNNEPIFTAQTWNLHNGNGSLGIQGCH